MATLVEVRNLTKYFPVRSGNVIPKVVGQIKAVDNISFSIQRGETFGLVGESGCGKTTTGRLILWLVEPFRGEVTFNDRNVFKCKGSELRKLRREMQIVFQDPFSSLNPRMTVRDIIGFNLYVHGLKNRGFEGRIQELLAMVGLKATDANKYPHEFSGGQLQRVAIARALATKPTFIVADEPVSSLDVSVQALILNLLKELQREMGLTYLFISHNLRVVEHMSQRIAVMYLGKIVELAPSDLLYDKTLHPYSQGLISSIPIPSVDTPRRRMLLEGEIPTALNLPSGCRFRTRCPRVFAQCSIVEPDLEEIVEGHYVACHLHGAGATAPNEER